MATNRLASDPADEIAAEQQARGIPRRAGAAGERAEIVAWLRSEAERLEDAPGHDAWPIKANYWREAADAIERGEHDK